MHVAIYLPLLVAAVLGWLAPSLARLLPPATAARLLTVAGAVTAAATSFVLAVLAFTLVAELAPVARLGSWSRSGLDASNPVPDVASVVAGAAVCVLAMVTARVAFQRVRAALAARALCTRLGGGPGELMVVDDPAVDVFAVPSLRGRIVASRLLLSSLPADERRAVLAHETAHLRQHHHRYRILAELAAATNPLLRRLVPAVEYATERWADEVAARAVGDRAVVARALARTGLRSAAPGRPELWAAAALRAGDVGSPLVRRVEALLEPAPRHRPLLVAVVVAMLVLTVGASVEAQRDTERLFENATSSAGHPLR
ncbi:MAG: M56 family metallopeptidase [Spirochaetaceae bacterium]|nr:M56 family metallopeptidase [Spirochaetaceae bacterium]